MTISAAPRPVSFDLHEWRDTCSDPATGSGSAEPGSASTDRVAELSRALGHSARVAIVEMLSSGEARVVNDIVARSGLAQSTVSEHLRILRAAGIVSCRRDGPRSWYRLRGYVLQQLADALDDLAEPTAPPRVV